MNTRTIAFIALCLVISATRGQAAETIDRKGFYLISDVGANFVNSIQFDRILGVSTAGSDSVQIHPGVKATLGAGYYFHPDLAAELETGFSYNKSKEYNSGTVTGGIPFNGSLRMWYVPVTVGLTWRPTLAPPPPPHENEIQYGQRFFHKVRPSLGFGIGGAEVFAEFTDFPASTNPVDSSGHDIVLSYYLKAGFSYPITPNADLGLQYRFYGSPGFEINQSKAEDIFSHVVSVVLEWRF